MAPDDYQQAWQAQSSKTRVTIDADVLSREVQRNQRDFRAMIFRRDSLEIGVALLLLPYWFYAGITHDLPWTWYLTVPALFWVVGFILVDRKRHRQQRVEPGEPLLESAKESLNQVEHQIWLLRNILWWYLLPFAVPILLFFVHVTLDVDTPSYVERFVFLATLCVYLVALYAFIYYLNQRAVRVQLQPRREELLALLASLGDESTNEHGATSDVASLESSRQLRHRAIVAAVCVVVVVVIALAAGSFESSYDQPPQSSGPEGEPLASLVTEVCQEKDLVGLAAMVMVDGQLEAAAAYGERKKGSGVPLEIGDRWHLGGITKSMTATMIARLVESGRMDWSDTVGDVLPEAAIHEDWKRVPLWRLLTDTAGAPRNFAEEVRRNRPPLGPESTRARREAVLDVIADEPAYPPGEKYAYSNVGHAIAAAMAEKVTGANWEDLVEREVFEPLELASAGFGPPQSSDETLEQPRGHRVRRGKRVPVDDDADNTSIMGPAGMVHMSLQDLCMYATEHLRGELGEGRLLSAETYKLLHKPELNRYAYGWIKKEPTAELPHTSYWHNGSNTMWYALVVFIPEKNMVIAVTSNDGDIENAEAAAWEVVRFGVDGR